MRLFTISIGEIILMYDGAIYCSFCKKSLDSDVEKEQGYHESCYQEVVRENPGFFLLSQLDTYDQVLVEKLQKALYKSSLTHKEEVLILTANLFSRLHTLEIQVENVDGKKEITSIIYTIEGLGSFSFSFKMQDKAILHDLVNTSESFPTSEFNISRSYYYHIPEILFDAIASRRLSRVLSLKDIEYISKLKEITKLLCVAISDKYIVLMNSGYFRIDEYGRKPARIFGPFIRLELDENNSVIGIIIMNFDNEILEEILDIKKDYLQYLSLIATFYWNPASLFEKFLNLNRLDSLNLFLDFRYVANDPDAEKEMIGIDYYFDYSYIKHLQIENLGLWSRQNQAVIKNLPKTGTLQNLILQNFKLPDISNWTINTLILYAADRYDVLQIENIISIPEINYKRLPVTLKELYINYQDLINIDVPVNTFPLITKIIAIVKEKTVNKTNKILKIFPNTSIDIRYIDPFMNYFPFYSNPELLEISKTFFSTNVKYYHIPDLHKVDWYFQNTLNY